MDLIIHQGDRYYLSFVIKIDNELVTDENCEGCKIKVNDVEVYPTFSKRYNSWLFPVTQEMTLKWKRLQYQCQVKVDGDTILTSDIESGTMSRSIIKTLWENLK